MEDWPDFIKQLDESIKVELFDELDKIARNYKQDLVKLNAEEIKQKLNFQLHNRMFNTNKQYDAEAPLKALVAKFKAETAVVVKSFEQQEKLAENQDLAKEEKFAQFEKNKKDIIEGNKPLTRKELKANDFAINKVEITQEEQAREKLIAEIKAAQERNRTRDRER